MLATEKENVPVKRQANTTTAYGNGVKQSYISGTNKLLEVILSRKIIYQFYRFKQCVDQNTSDT